MFISKIQNRLHRSVNYKAFSGIQKHNLLIKEIDDLLNQNKEITDSLLQNFCRIRSVMDRLAYNINTPIRLKKLEKIVFNNNDISDYSNMFDCTKRGILC